MAGKLAMAPMKNIGANGLPKTLCASNHSEGFVNEAAFLYLTPFMTVPPASNTTDIYYGNK